MMRQTAVPPQQRPATRLRNLMADTDFGMDFANGQDSAANDSEASAIPANSTSTVKMSKSDGVKQAKGFILPRRLSGALKQSTVEENPKPPEPQKESTDDEEDDLQIHQAVPIKYAPEQVIKPSRQITERKRRPAKRQEYEEESSDETPSYERREAKKTRGRRNRTMSESEYSEDSDDNSEERYENRRQRRREHERRRNEYSEDSEPP